MLREQDHPTDALPEFGSACSRSELGSWVIAWAAFMLVALRQTYVLPAIPLSLSPGRFLLFAGAGVFLISCVVGWKARYRLGVMGLVLTLYTVSNLAAYGVGMTQESIPLRTADYYLVVEVMLVLVVVFYFNVVRSYLGLSRVVKGLIAGGVVSATFALSAHVSGADLATALRPPGLVEKGSVLAHDLVRVGVVRTQGSAGHPLELAAVLTILFPLAVGLTYSLRAAGKRWWPWSVASLIILIGIAVSVSRSALIGVFAAFVVMALYWPIRRTLAMIVGAVGLTMLMFIVSPVLFNAYSSTLGLGADDPSAQYRLAAAQHILSNLSLFGSFGDSAGASGFIFDDQYLYRLSQAGLFGLLSYAVLLGTSLVLAFRAFANARKRKNPELPVASAHLFLGLAASLTAYAVMNTVLDMGGFLQIWTTMWLLLATSAVAYRLSRSPDEGPSNVRVAPSGITTRT